MKKAKKYVQNRAAKQATARSRTRSKTDKARQKRALEHMIRSLGYEPSQVHVSLTENDPHERSSRAEQSLSATGRFTSASAGYGFVRTEQTVRDIFIPAEYTQGALTGDTVEIRYRRFHRADGERTEGRVTRIVDRITTVIGTLKEHTPPYMRFGSYRHSFTVIPDDRRCDVRPVITDVANAVLGDKVEVLLDRTHSRPLRGRVVRSFGQADTCEANYMAILAAASVETEFSEAALAEAEEAASRPIDTEGRCDLRRETVFTIDGADAKDLDDALSVRRLAGGGFTLGVHIADVASYVKEKSALERTAMRRGCSLYFTDKVVPMLPPVLSNGACSLNAGEDKAALSVHITLSAEGEIRGVTIRKTILRSKCRGVYGEINDVLSEGKASPYYAKYRPIHHALQTLCELYRVLKTRSRERAALELESREAVIRLDENGHPVDILPRERGLAEDIIEQCMLAANEAVATCLTERGIPCVYRVHERPPVEKAQELLQYLRSLSLDTRGMHADDLRSHDLVRILKEADERGLLYPVSQRMLRCMSKATYESTQKGHFGLGIACYCHFTAPIRRVSDLAVHRVIHRVLLAGRPSGAYISFATRAARAATDGELRALGAERRIEQLYKALFMKDKLGEIFDVTVSSVTPYGLYCITDKTCEGFVGVEDLGGSFTFDERHLCLRSRETTYRIGDSLRVCLCEVDLATASLRFRDAALDACLADDAHEVQR